MPAPVGLAYDVVAPIIDADSRMDILLQIAAAVNVCINEVNVILEAERGGLLYNPSSYAGIVFSVDDIEKRCGQEIGTPRNSPKNAKLKYPIIINRYQLSPTITQHAAETSESPSHWKPSQSQPQDS